MRPRFHTHTPPLSFTFVLETSILFFLVFIINIRHHFHTITHPLSRGVLIFTHTSPFLLLCTSTFTHTSTFTQNHFYFLADCLHFMYILLDTPLVPSTVLQSHSFTMTVSFFLSPSLSSSYPSCVPPLTWCLFFQTTPQTCKFHPAGREDSG